MLSVAEHFLEQQMHPTVVISAYRKALDDMISTLKKIRYWGGAAGETDVFVGGEGRPRTAHTVAYTLVRRRVGRRVRESSHRKGQSTQSRQEKELDVFCKTFCSHVLLVSMLGTALGNVQ